MDEQVYQTAGGAPVDHLPGLQRLSLLNGVFYVHQNPDPAEAEPEVVPEPEAQPEPEPQPEPVRAVWPAWPARSAPPSGYAYEFGTGRLVRVFLGQ